MVLDIKVRSKKIERNLVDLIRKICYKFPSFVNKRYKTYFMEQNLNGLEKLLRATGIWPNEINVQELYDRFITGGNHIAETDEIERLYQITGIKPNEENAQRFYKQVIKCDTSIEPVPDNSEAWDYAPDKKKKFLIGNTWLRNVERMYAITSIRPADKEVVQYGYQILLKFFGYDFVNNIIRFYKVTNQKPNEKMIRDGHEELVKRRRKIDAVRLRRFASYHLDIDIGKPSYSKKS